jgi:cob(I)alamin adenosyltransferase
MILNYISSTMKMRQMSTKNGLVIVYTGNGKGKTTAALGIVLRAVGHGMKVGMIQFIKGEWYYGELTSARRLEPEFDLVAAGKVALDLIRKKMSEKKYDILILDEINYAAKIGLISVSEILDILKRRPKGMTLVLTGNYAPQEIIDLADLVTEMREVKHPYKLGIKAEKGIDF